MWKQLGTLSFMLTAAALIAGCGGGSSKDKTSPDKQAEKESGKKPEDSGPPITISAEQLAKEFKTDAAEADKKYKGRTLIVEGKMHGYYDKEVFKESSLILWGYREKELEVPKLVQCFFTKDSQKKLETYKEKEKLEEKDRPKVKVKGTGAGSIDGLHYQVRECVFLDN
jgi:hypothetical protein